MFEQAIALFARYEESLLTEEESELVLNTEIGKRLGQIAWLYARAMHLADLATKNLEQIPPAADFQLTGELEIVSESFYHFANRLRALLRAHPHFKSFESKGVRDVRNHLLVHPEAKNDAAKRFYSFSLATDGKGPRIRAYAGGSGTYDDQGLFARRRIPGISSSCF